MNGWRPRFRSILVVSAVGLFAALAGCAGEDTTDGTRDTAPDDPLSTGARRTVDLKYEGTCEFLRNCSSFSQGLPPGQVSWGCTGRGACSDSALWVAGPDRSHCGKTVNICKGGKCVNALVKDVSVSGDWEASNGVLSSLDIPFGLTGRCSGFGGGTVTLGPATSSGPSSSSDGSCMSETLGRRVPEKSCVESRSDKDWFQCVDGEWFGGVSGDGSKGPAGACIQRHPLP